MPNASPNASAVSRLREPAATISPESVSAAAAEGVRAVERVDRDAVGAPRHLEADRVEPAIAQVDQLRGVEPVDPGRDRPDVLHALALRRVVEAAVAAGSSPGDRAPRARGR